MLKKILNKYNSLSLPMKAALWYAICNFINKGIALISTPIFTRIMTEEQYGTFAIFQSWFNILIIFTSLNIFMNSFIKGLITYEKDRKTFTSSLLSLTTLITTFYFIIYIFNIDFWTDFFDLSPKLMIAMFLELLVMPALEFWMADQRVDYKYKNVIVVSVFMNVICLALSVITVILSSNKIEARVLSDVFVKFLFAGVLFIYIMYKGKLKVKLKYWKYALAFNIPLLPHYLSNYILNQSDRIMIGKMVGKTEAAFYSVSYTISTVIMLLVFAINNAMIPYIYKSIKNGEVKKIKNKITPIVIGIGFLTIIVMALAPEVIKIFAGKNYLDAIYVIPPVAASVYYIYIYSTFSTIEYYYQKTSLIAIATSISAVLNLILNYIFINKYGYYAAGYTTLVCYMCLSLFHYLFYKKIIKKELPNIDSVYNVKIMIIIGIIIIVAAIFMNFLYNYNIIRYILITILLIISIINRNKIKNIIMNF